MPDLRHKQRSNSPHRVNVLSADDGRIFGRLVNINTDGLMFLGQEPLRVRQELRLRIPLPVPSQNRNAIEVEARVIWCAGDSNPNYHRVGVEFVKVGAEEGFLIDTVLRKMHLIG